MEAIGLQNADVLLDGSGAESYVEFIETALGVMAREAELPTHVAVQTMTVFQETMIGVVHSPIDNLSLSEVSKLSGGAAVGLLALKGGSYWVAMGAMAGGIFLINFAVPVIAAAGKRTAKAIEEVDLIELWRRIKSVVKSPDSEP